MTAVLASVQGSTTTGGGLRWGEHYTGRVIERFGAAALRTLLRLMPICRSFQEKHAQAS